MNSATLKQFGFVFFGMFVLDVLFSSSLRADIVLPKIFTDHMVLQQNSNVRISGTAEPAQKLLVKFASKEMKATADDKGAWAVMMPTPAAGGPYELEVVAEAGQPKIVFSDILVGEVWLCAGHNMELPVSSSLNAKTEIELSKNFPKIRLFKVDHSASVVPLADFAKVDPWRICSPDAVKDFSATAYFFGRELSKGLEENVPIGLIDISWDWAPAESWCSREAMDKVESLAPLLRHWDESDKPPTDKKRPGNLFNGMVAPMAGFPVRGVTWYQGEANHGRGHQYATLLPTLIGDWRKTLGNPELPFYFVQLAPYRYKGKSTDGLAELWDAQFKTVKTVPHTAMVVTTDIGDLEEIYPKNKQEVGRRLSLAALSKVYAKKRKNRDKKLIASGPLFESMSTNKNRIRLLFAHAKGLRVRNQGDPPNCFLICGKDKTFFPATAKIDGEAIEVSSPKVTDPIAVRYCWNDSVQPNLVNQAGLPASPFRTDDFPLESVGQDIGF
ncbi:MAG: sialate O-acetylesterase [Mariniblastus sp.]|nr:sialate O-acetylesterase [Mariniblastus sp.]